MGGEGDDGWGWGVSKMMVKYLYMNSYVFAMNNLSESRLCEEGMYVDRMKDPSRNMTRVGSNRPSLSERARLAPKPLLMRIFTRPTPIISCKPSTTDSHAGAYSTHLGVRCEV